MFDDEKYPAEEMADQADLFAAFTGVKKTIQPRDRIFLVMGMTGAGKSTFINRCTGKNVTVGHSLYSCTSSVGVFDYTWNDRKIYLVDTPGFNDTNRSDFDTLDILAKCLSASYANGVRIHGILMLHPITDNRMSGSSMRNMEMMKALCGFSSYRNLAIATTMWPNDPSDVERSKLEARDDQLLAGDAYFGALVGQGATVFRHSERGDRESADEAFSAQRIVAHLVRQSERHPPEVLRLQRELVDEGKGLGETAAGICVAESLDQTRKAHERELRDMERDMTNQLAHVDATHAAQLEEIRADLVKRLADAEQQREALNKSIREMHRESQSLYVRTLWMAMSKCQTQMSSKMKLLKEAKAEYQTMRDSKLTEVHEISKSYHEVRKQHRELRKEIGRVPKTSVKSVEYEERISNIKGEISRIKVAYHRIASNREHIINGTSNGIAAGVTSSIIAASAGAACTVM